MENSSSFKKTLPLGIDDFRELREGNRYFVDKSLIIRDFIRYDDKATLVTRPRRFGKTLNMTMLRDFFDITQDSRAIFEGLAIMETEYAGEINSQPVIYLSLKECAAGTAEGLRKQFNSELYMLFNRYAKVFEDKANPADGDFSKFYQIYRELNEGNADYDTMQSSLKFLVMAVYAYFGQPVLLFIDEYDQPIISSYENGYRDGLKDFFNGFFSCVLKGNVQVKRALLTGIQRVAKESIFSKLNNISVYSVLHKRYCEYFGLTEGETAQLLSYYNLELNDDVKKQYDGYNFGGIGIYNPWSILCYARDGKLMDYWVNTSTNVLIREAVKSMDDDFREDYEQLMGTGSVDVGVRTETSFIERQSQGSLWGLLINSGYLTVEEALSEDCSYLRVGIPNGEVRSELARIMSEMMNLADDLGIAHSKKECKAAYKLIEL